jgi:hypothetical protein
MPIRAFPEAEEKRTEEKTERGASHNTPNHQRVAAAPLLHLLFAFGKNVLSRLMVPGKDDGYRLPVAGRFVPFKGTPVLSIFPPFCPHFSPQHCKERVVAHGAFDQAYLSGSEVTPQPAVNS